MKHTQKEYLAWIDEQIADWLPFIDDPVTSNDYWAKAGTASLLANRDVLVAPRSETNLALRGNAWREGYNQCLENLKTDVTNRLDEVMG